MVSKLRHIAAQHLVNMGGWRTNRKIVVIESDDWGSIRMPSTEVYDKLLNKGVPVDKSPYCRYDSLASETDLEALFETLSKFQDSNGNHPVITANVLTANPDFDKIRDSGFQKYYFEQISETFKRYPEHENSLTLWKKGDKKRLFHPQSHGREHLNVPFWLKLLRNDEYDFRLAFDNRCWGLSSDIYPKMKKSIQASFDADTADEIEDHKKIIKSGLKIFEEIFGYRTASFIASNYIWSSELNPVLKKEGVRYLQGMKYQKLPGLNEKSRSMERRYLGGKNKNGQLNLVRNCSFEPSLSVDKDYALDSCLNGVSTAFLWRKPAIITSHRINYVGFLHPENRDCNLKLMRKLLQRILDKWPEVEFMTSDELGQVIE
ncbi:hypothetical protein DYD21_20615 [Rhodohalobacter sp. SW132]|uniref:hypothetical protein n=1 Tax=Rhodohalobacter sp. SW132 TaxID=2293433 RepID=UPI000E25A8A3|nr:hypothetical protein [Rhodohalobacter sp. SW132]REL23942.1 hypothetical protein DYD21_20615 [Rhodohalobacter sp. SW132]